TGTGTTNGNGGNSNTGLPITGGNITGNGGNSNTGLPATGSNTSNDGSAKTLPQTGENDDVAVLGLLGAGLLALTAGSALAGLKRRKETEDDANKIDF
ncbi:LPXTG cell wall anchor domain-containing protein, partial [Lacticaseibacillus paracasei]